MIRAARRRDAGFTLVELMVAIVIFGFVMAAALNFLRLQGRSVALGNDRMNALENLQFALATMEQRLRAAGAAVPNAQPQLVYAGPNVVAFNANYTTNIANDPFAVYYDPDAPDSAVTALTLAQSITLPLTSFVYPETSYTVAGINSPAETIIFFLSPDSTTPRPDDYILFEQVNNMKPEMVSRNIIGSPTTAYFQYYHLVSPVVGNAYLDSVPNAKLPLMHTVKIHLSAADTAAGAAIDSIRGILVTLTVTNGQTGTAERRHTVTKFIQLPNVGLANHATCGDAPILGTALTAVDSILPSGATAVKLTWNAAVDQTGGQKSVVRYVLWRKLTTDPTWGDPYVSVPAGTPSYLYLDAAVASFATYQYELAAEDCTPTMSAPTTSGFVTIP